MFPTVFHIAFMNRVAALLLRTHRLVKIPGSFKISTSDSVKQNTHEGIKRETLIQLYSHGNKIALLKSCNFQKHSKKDGIEEADIPPWFFNIAGHSIQSYNPISLFDI